MKMTTLLKMVKAVTTWMESVEVVRELSKVSVEDAAENLISEIHDCIYLQLDDAHADDLIISLDSENNGIRIFKTVREKYLTKGFSRLIYIYGENKTEIELTATLMCLINRCIEQCM